MSFVLGTLIAGLAAACAGVNFWVAYQLRAAERAWQEDRLDDTRRHLDLAMHFRPGPAHLFAARVERMLGHYEEAEGHLRACRPLGGITERVQLEWVLLRALQGELSSLESALRKNVTDDDASAPLILETLAIGYLQEFRYRAALACLSQMLARDPENLRALDSRSRLWEKLNSNQGVIDDCRRALAVCPHLWRVRLRLVSALLKDKGTQAAHKHLQQLEQEHPALAEVRTQRARWQILQGEASKARKTLEAILADDPEAAEALFLRGRSEDDPGRAERYFRLSLDADPLNNEAWYGLYLSLSRQGESRSEDARQAKARYEKNERDAVQLREGLDQFEKAPSPQLAVDIGEIYMRRGIPSSAGKFFLKALQMDGRSSRAREMLERLDRRPETPSRR